METGNVTLSPEYVGRDADLKAGEYAMLAVTDTGRGMSEAVEARGFEPFSRTRTSDRGRFWACPRVTGSSTKRGHINVYSEAGVDDAQDLSAGGGAGGGIARAGGGGGNGARAETILLVEDFPASPELAATLLRRLGYAVWEAGNGIEALSLKQQRGVGHVDLLFTDVVMPHMSGKE